MRDHKKVVIVMRRALESCGGGGRAGQTVGKAPFQITAEIRNSTARRALGTNLVAGTGPRLAA